MAAPPAKIRALSIFEGLWNTTGEIAGPKKTALIATDAYEFLPGGHFLLHRVDARLGGQAHRSIEIYAYDKARKTLVSRSYDDQGESHEFTAALKGRRWTIQGEALRFAGRFDDDGTVLTGRWEQLAAGSGWAPLMDIRLEKA